MNSIVVVPPEDALHNTDAALKAWTAAREGLARAAAQVHELEALGVDNRGRVVGPGNPGVKVGPTPMLAPARERLEEARWAYDLAWAAYLEAARSREARAAHELAAASVDLAKAQAKAAGEGVELARAQLDGAVQNAAIADSVRRLTKWVTIATIVQAIVGTLAFAAAVVSLVHTWRK